MGWLSLGEGNGVVKSGGNDEAKYKQRPLSYS